MLSLRGTRWFVAALWLALAAPLLAAEPPDKPRTTEFPATASPDQICLTWTGDPMTTQAVQWRAAATVDKGVVQYRKSSEPDDAATSVDAAVTTLTDPLIENDPSVHHFTATITGLEPGTAYAYRVGNGNNDNWSNWFSFQTAPKGAVPLTFFYVGDAQVGHAEWGDMMRKAYARFPKAAFTIMAGDLVNKGLERDNWDALFDGAKGLFDVHALVPAVGNHEYSRTPSPRLYLEHLALPSAGGPDAIAPELCYAFTYGNAFFVILDGTEPAQAQRDWLEKQLAGSTATWKFAVYHQPAYSSAPRRDNIDIREQWGALFEKYHVDMALQGHDHAYLRTYPMKGGKRVDSARDGVYYVVSCSGSKFYDLGEFDYAEVSFKDTATYQVLDIQTEGGDMLTYRAYDATGAMRDEVIIKK